mmetsp:Transcript_11120/g.21123  ORF Transcript_11120/g.21123 Transcript_11120/m.21123 type:complete len:1543 (+) Transcript_11120:74-4702(+)
MSQHRELRISNGKVSYLPETVTYASNYVVSARYTWYNFIPMNLFEQFSNPSNMYFFFIGVLQMIGPVSTTNGDPTMYQTLGLVIIASAARAAYEDIAQHKADEQRNSMLYEKWNGPNELCSVQSGAVKVGDIIKIKKDQMVPADMVLLSTSTNTGMCFLDKANLNGETTLEIVSSVPETRKYFAEESPEALNGTFSFEQPTKNFDTFHGIFDLTEEGGSTSHVVVNRPLVLREVLIRHVDYVYGLVVYTGRDTKLLMTSNTKFKKAKVSSVFRTVNFCLVGMFLLQVLMCLVAGTFSGYLANSEGQVWYLLPVKYGPVTTGVLAFFTWFIVLFQMVPITLVVSSEMVKFGLSSFITPDRYLYDIRTHKRARVNTATIHEELGLIDYIFSDKTGTLTRNRMEFRFLLLPDRSSFGSDETEIAVSVKSKSAELKRDSFVDHSSSQKRWTRLVRSLLPPEIPDPCLTSKFSCCWNGRRKARPIDESEMPQTNREFTEAERQDILTALWMPSKKHKLRQKQLYDFMLNMALSNTVKPYVDDDGVQKFQAESAEEASMVNFARSVGFVKLSTSPTVVELRKEMPASSNKAGRVKVSKLTFNRLATFGFSSERARVTIIYQEVETLKIHVMSKGADTPMLQLLRSNNRPALEDQDELLLKLSDMASNGLRTLVCAYSVLPAEWWCKDIEQKYEDLTTRDSATTEEGQIQQKKELDEFFLSVEQAANLNYLGCMGLEDQLQPLVPESIRDYLKADIKVWMITGDKLETAKNIALACNLIDPNMVPSLDPAMDLDEMAKCISNSRLIEITGQWANLAEDAAEMAKLFEMLDEDKSGTLERSELSQLLESLNFPLDSLQEFAADGSGGDGVTKAQFVDFLRSLKLSRFEAVKNDVLLGAKLFDSITDHKANPISILLSMEAFEVMFPDTTEVADIQSVTSEQLEELRDQFFSLASVSKSVVFARARPVMKKRMVTEIQKRFPKKQTLAIGDGANDTDMIKAAHVGVGIRGVEGTAATNSADYAIGNFRMLHTLLFVHGFWSYHRVCTLILIIFYKASLLSVCGYVYGFYSQFSGQQFFYDAILNLYNVFFTSMPVIIVAWFDQPVARPELENNPSVYREARGTKFSVGIFIAWVFRAFAHSFIVFYLCAGVFLTTSSHTPDGLDYSMMFFSTTIFVIICFLPTVMLFFELRTINLFHHISVWFCSVGSLFFFSSIFSLEYLDDFYYLFFHMLLDGKFWLAVVLCLGVTFVLELMYRGWWVTFRPSFTQLTIEKVFVSHKDKALNQGRKSRASKSGGDQYDEAPDSPAAEKLRYQDSKDSESSLSFVYQEQDERAWTGSRKDTAEEEFLGAKRKLSAIVQRTASSADATNNKKSALIVAILRFSRLTGPLFDAPEAPTGFHQNDEKAAMSSKSSSQVTATSSHLEKDKASLDSDIMEGISRTSRDASDVELEPNATEDKSVPSATAASAAAVSSHPASKSNHQEQVRRVRRKSGPAPASPSVSAIPEVETEPQMPRRFFSPRYHFPISSSSNIRVNHPPVNVRVPSTRENPR